MRNIARFAFHLGRNALRANYRYYRLSAGEKGRLLFYDRHDRRFFRVRSRGYIDSVTANQVLSGSEYDFAFIGREEQVRGMYRQILAAGRVPLILDCGANIGVSSLYFARQFPEARVIAIEPNAANVALARQNCADLANVDIRQAAIGSERGKVAIENIDADANAFRVGRVADDADDGIALVTVPDLLAERSDTDLFIAKIDIEGFERDLFSRNVGWIGACDMLVVELHDWMLPGQSNSVSFLRAIAGYDRDIMFRGESVFSIRNDQARTGE